MGDSIPKRNSDHRLDRDGCQRELLLFNLLIEMLCCGILELNAISKHLLSRVFSHKEIQEYDIFISSETRLIFSLKLL